MLHDDYPSLWQLGGLLPPGLGSRLHVPRWSARETSSKVSRSLHPKLADEIERVLALEKSDDELDELILEFGSSYLPTSNGVRSQTWLIGIRDLAQTLPRP